MRDRRGGEAIHPRRRVVVYDAACAGPISVGPSSFNPAGFGFGGYSYGGYPYYGYWGNLPGPYAGFSGYGPAAGPAYGLTGYSAYPMAIAPPGAPGCGAGGMQCGLCRCSRSVRSLLDDAVCLSALPAADVPRDGAMWLRLRARGRVLSLWGGARHRHARRRWDA